MPLTCHMLWRKYEAHVAWLYFYKFHICDSLFPQNFCFENFGWNPWVFKNNNHAMIVMMNAYFWHIWNIGNHTLPCILMNFFSWGGNSERNVELLIRILSSSSLDSFSPPYFVSLTIFLWSYLTDTCNKSFGRSCGSVWP